MIESTGISGRLPVLSAPGERGATFCAGYLENVAGCCRCVRIESANRRITNRRARCRWIKGDIKNWPIRKDCIAAGDIYPGGLIGSRSKPEADLDIAVVSPNHHGRLQRLRNGQLIDERAVT